eukprot:364738-Chlamydomonas_euryale.AAC.2
MLGDLQRSMLGYLERRLRPACKTGACFDPCVAAWASHQRAPVQATRAAPLLCHFTRLLPPTGSLASARAMEMIHPLCHWPLAPSLPRPCMSPLHLCMDCPTIVPLDWPLLPLPMHETPAPVRLAGALCVCANSRAQACMCKQSGPNGRVQLVGPRRACANSRAQACVCKQSRPGGCVLAAVPKRTNGLMRMPARREYGLLAVSSAIQYVAHPGCCGLRPSSALGAIPSAHLSPPRKLPVPAFVSIPDWSPLRSFRPANPGIIVPSTERGESMVWRMVWQAMCGTWCGACTIFGLLQRGHECICGVHKASARRWHTMCDGAAVRECVNV